MRSDPLMVLHPFLHTIIDDAFAVELINASLAEWPSSEWPHWHVYADGNSNKRATKDPSRLTPSASLLINQMSALPVSSWFNVQCFPDLALHGAGMHEMLPGGYLRKHLDAEQHPSMPWHRKLSGVLFLDNCDGGYTGCDGALRFEGVTILPKKNRLVLFECAENSWHEVNCVPNGESRKTLALFWWQKSERRAERTSARFA